MAVGRELFGAKGCASLAASSTSQMLESYWSLTDGDHAAVYERANRPAEKHSYVPRLGTGRRVDSRGRGRRHPIAPGGTSCENQPRRGGWVLAIQRQAENARADEGGRRA